VDDLLDLFHRIARDSFLPDKRLRVIVNTFAWSQALFWLWSNHDDFYFTPRRKREVSDFRPTASLDFYLLPDCA
jgi:hypothetical protein